MPTSPNPAVPSILPAITDDASVKPRDTTAPASAQNAPIANLAATDSPEAVDSATSLLVAASTYYTSPLVCGAGFQPACRLEACTTNQLITMKTSVRCCRAAP